MYMESEKQMSIYTYIDIYKSKSPTELTKQLSSSKSYFWVPPPLIWTQKEMQEKKRKGQKTENRHRKQRYAFRNHQTSLSLWTLLLSFYCLHSSIQFIHPSTYVSNQGYAQYTHHHPRSRPCGPVQIPPGAFLHINLSINQSTPPIQSNPTSPSTIYAPILLINHHPLTTIYHNNDQTLLTKHALEPPPLRLQPIHYILPPLHIP